MAPTPSPTEEASYDIFLLCIKVNIAHSLGNRKAKIPKFQILFCGSLHDFSRRYFFKSSSLNGYRLGRIVNASSQDRFKSFR
jgi:hypothetical protein